jgi:hypothetical protein
MRTAHVLSVTLFALLLVGAGCSSGGDPTARPSGWEGTDTKWWRAGVDTSGAFRDLESLKAMGILETEATRVMAMQQVSTQQFAQAVRRSLVRLYRNDPATIDSLFREYAEPRVAEVSLSGSDIRQKVDEYKRIANRAIENHYRTPRVQEQPGIPYPDSLRQQNVTGSVVIQARLDDTGEPQALELLQSVHPTLDRIAMRTAAQTTWRPAFVLKNENWVQQPSWDRFSIDFTSTGG